MPENEREKTVKMKPVFEITTNIKCTLACKYCPQAVFVKEYKKRSDITSLSMEAFEKCINKIPIDVEIRFGGFSEPWLNNRCTDMLLYAYNKGHNISVFTTLVGIDPQDIEKLEKVNFAYFSVHLPSENNFENIDLNDRYLKTLERLCKSKIAVEYHYHGTGIKSSVKDYVVKKEVCQAQITPKCGHVKIEGVSYPSVKKVRLSCPLGLRCNMLLPNGDVVLCCMDYALQYVLGNIFVSDYNSLFETQKFISIKRGLKDKSSEILCHLCEFAIYDNFFMTNWARLCKKYNWFSK